MLKKNNLKQKYGIYDAYKNIKKSRRVFLLIALLFRYRLYDCLFKQA